MVTSTWVVLLAGIWSVNAFPQFPTTPLKRTEFANTIFGDERLKGEIFENLDAFSDVTFYNDDSNPYRLPDDTMPHHYDILWTIDMVSLSYSGTVNIQIYATRAGVSEIILHSSHHTINSITLTPVNDLNNEIALTYTFLEEYHFLRIRPSVDLEYNADSPVYYRLTITFEAPMRQIDDMYGIYRSWYRNNATTEQDVTWMATTQFQATAARYAFPCYDEPKFKATFDITIRRPIGYRSWSCTKRTTQNAPVTGWQDDVYETTPVMSTYLLALIVADYESIPQNNQIADGQLDYEVIGRPGAINDGQGIYALEVGEELLTAMSQHTGIDFYNVSAGLKMTQAAIPDFGAGAMENWGLLTYREAYLMFDEEHTDNSYKQIIAYILSHEIAHMWFGNLVTNDWWDVLWLNEGFARYYQYFLTHWVETEMGFETRFITEQIHTSLLSDSSNNPQPLTNPGIGSPASVSSMFSTISYNKGAVIIRQTEHLLGFEVHRTGLHNYLDRKRFSTSLPIDLFTDLEEAALAANAIQEYGSDFDFKEYYRSWTEQPGHPVLNVFVNHATGAMTITQRRFNINTGYGANNNNYIVPLTFATASNPNFVNTKPTHIIKDTVTVINRGSVGDEWVIFNVQQTGHYRVNYDDYTWNLIALALRGSARTTIHEYNRAQIVNDIFQFARSGLITYTRAFDVLSFLEYENEYAPWVAAITGFNWIRNRLQGTAELTRLENTITNWARPLMNNLTYYESENDSFMRTYLRRQIAQFMCVMADTDCRQAALTQFRQLVDNGVEVTPNNRVFVYCNGLRQGTEADFNFMWNRFLNHNTYTEKITLLSTLGCTPYTASLTTLLNNIVQDNYVIRPQDYTTAWSAAVSGNEGNTQIVFTYVQQNLATVIQAFGGAATPLSYISSRLRTETEIINFENWVNQNQANLGTQYANILAGVTNSRQSIAWAAEVADDINNYIDNGGENIGTTTSTTPPPVGQSTTRPEELVQPTDPDIPDSASTSFLSLYLVAVALAAKMIL